MAASTYNFEKDPDDTLDYTFDWTAWLNGDQISALRRFRTLASR